MADASSLAFLPASASQYVQQGGGGQCYPAGPTGPEERGIVRARCRRPCRRPIGNQSTEIYVNATGGKSQPHADTLPLISLQTRLVGAHGGNQTFQRKVPSVKMATTRCARKFSIADFSGIGAQSHLHGIEGTELRDPPPPPTTNLRGVIREGEHTVGKSSFCQRNGKEA